MMLRSCKRSEDVASMVRMGYWPDGCEEELREHIAGCGHCREWILLTQSFQQARSESFEETPQRSSFLLWWRAELRRRDAALKQVSLPMTLAHRFALVVGLVSAMAFLVLARASLLGWFALDSLKGFWTGFHADLSSFLALFGTGNGMLFVSGLAAVALLGGVVYLATDGQ
jgi:hypothetical protein